MRLYTAVCPMFTVYKALTLGALKLLHPTKDFDKASLNNRVCQTPFNNRLSLKFTQQPTMPKLHSKRTT